MNFLTSIFLGLIQGLTEFLPVSSSGHLALFQNIFGLQEAGMFFDVLLHLGTLVAIFVFYWKDIKGMILEAVAFVRELAGARSSKPTVEAQGLRRMILLILVGTLPLFLILPFHKKIEALSGNTLFVGFALIVTGCLLYFADRMANGKKGVRRTKITDVLAVGLGQAVATVPGLSRSGTTIAVGMMMGLDRRFAVRYSFLLSLPAVIGANILTLADAAKAGINWAMLPVYIVGVCVAAMSGYWAIGFVKRLTDQGKFGKFAYYCWGIGAFTILLTLIFKLVNR